MPPPRGSGKESYLTAVTDIDNELVEIIDVEKVLAEVGGISTEVSREVVEDVTDVILEHHVLVVDDSSVARGQIKRTLEQLHVECTVANNGRAALSVLKKWADDDDPILKRLALIVSDVEMPEMDGYTLTTEVRKDPRLCHLFVLLHTSLSGTFNRAMVEKVGADRFVPKFKPDELAGEVLDRIRAFSNNERH